MNALCTCSDLRYEVDISSLVVRSFFLIGVCPVSAYDSKPLSVSMIVCSTLTNMPRETRDFLRVTKVDEARIVGPIFIGNYQRLS